MLKRFYSFAIAVLLGQEGQTIKSILMSIHSLCWGFAFLLVACSTSDPWVEPENYLLALDGRLEQDADGFYLLPLMRDRYQTVHRVTGTLLDTEGKPPYQEQEIHWESSHVWSFSPGDTVITIYRRNVDARGRWVVIDTAFFLAPSEMLVPTVNPTSYTSSTGELNTMIGPVLDMLGDTMTVSAMWTSQWYKTDTIRSTVRFILK